MIQHRKNNLILSLKSRYGGIFHTHADILTKLNDFYSNPLEEPQVERSQSIREITNNIPSILNHDHKKMLLQEVTMQEMEEAAMSMPNGKAPRSNGFAIYFFKVCCPFIKDEVHALVEDSRINKIVLKALNATFLTLIRKEEGDNSLDHFQPINPCNVIYKIISKVLDNKIKTVLPLLISSNQAEYVEG